MGAVSLTKNVAPTRSSLQSSDPRLDRIDDRLARMEAMMARMEALGAQAPGVLAMGGDVFDEWAARDGHADERLQALARLLERATRPEVLHALETLVGAVEQAPGLLAMFGDTVDELARAQMESGADLDALGKNLGGVARALVQMASQPGLLAMLEGGLFAPGALATLSDAARAIAETRSGETPRAGWLAVMRAMRDDDVQRALGFAIRVAAEMGQAMQTEATPRLPAGAGEAQ